MKTVLLSVIGLIVLVFVLAIIKGMNTAPSKLTIHEHPSSFDKPRIESVVKSKSSTESDMDHARFEDGLN